MPSCALAERLASSPVAAALSTRTRSASTVSWRSESSSAATRSSSKSIVGSFHHAHGEDVGAWSATPVEDWSRLGGDRCRRCLRIGKSPAAGETYAAAVEVRVLGVTDVVGAPSSHGASAPKVRQVLAVLAVRRGGSIDRGTLAEVLWPDGEPRSATKTIQTYIWTLRNALGADAIVTDGARYRLGPDVVVDVCEFEAEVVTAQEMLNGGRWQEAVAALDRALGRWRGPALVDVLDWATGQAEAARLEELRRYAEELHGEALASLHPDGAAIGDLEYLAQCEPLRERRWELLVGALTTAGRATEAVRAVRRARDRLAECGLEVGSELRRLERQALLPSTVDPPTTLQSLGDGPASLDVGGRNVWLPRPRTRLVGRDLDVAAVTTALGTSRMVTVTGVGGVGKTRIALAVADHGQGSSTAGVFWVELAPVRIAEDTIPAIATALGIRPRLGVALVDQVATALGDRPVLLALDNCEHVVVAVRHVAATLLERCNNLRIIATSRERIGVDGEWIVMLTPLAADGPGSPAVELLTERIEARGGERAEADLLVDIARRVDGLPLALELVAGRCQSLGAAEVISRLDNEPWLLSDQTLANERHRTLESVLRWSYELLSEIEQSVLQRLAVFASSFSLGAVERVVTIDNLSGDEAGHDDSRSAPVVVEAVGSLVERSLVERHGDRFRLLETTRQFAARQLAESGRQDAVEARHTTYVVGHVREIHHGLHGRDEADWVLTLDYLWPDVRVVIGRALADDDADTLLDVVVHLALEAFYRRPEALAWIRIVVDRYRDRPGPHRHELLGAGSLVAWTLLDVPASVELAEAALAACPPIGRPIDLLPHAAATGAFFYAGHLDRALEILGQELDDVTVDDATWETAQLACSHAITMAVLDPRRALSASARAVRFANAVANPSLIAYALAVEAQLKVYRDAHTAAATLERARAAAQLVRNTFLLTNLINVLDAELQAVDGRIDDALRAHLHAARELHCTGWSVHAWTPAWYAATYLHVLGRHDEAALLTGACQASGNLRLPGQRFPPELDALVAGHGEADRLALYELGAHLDLPELIRIASSEQPVPHPTHPGAS